MAAEDIGQRCGVQQAVGLEIEFQAALSLIELPYAGQIGQRISGQGARPQADR